MVVPVTSIAKHMWVKDAQVHGCQASRCKTKFKMFRVRKHHCRVCGNIFCDTCTPARGRDSANGDVVVRVCPLCYKRAVDEEIYARELAENAKVAYTEGKVANNASTLKIGQSAHSSDRSRVFDEFDHETL